MLELEHTEYRLSLIKSVYHLNLYDVDGLVESCEWHKAVVWWAKEIVEKAEWFCKLGPVDILRHPHAV